MSITAIDCIDLTIIGGKTSDVILRNVRGVNISKNQFLDGANVSGYGVHDLIAEDNIQHSRILPNYPKLNFNQGKPTFPLSFIIHGTPSIIFAIIYLRTKGYNPYNQETVKNETNV